MRRAISIMILVLLSGVFAYGVQAGAWITFKAPDARFSLLLPNEPKLVVVPHPENPQLIHKRYSDSEDGYVLLIEYFENVVNSPPEKYLDEVRDGMIGTLKGTVIREGHIKLGVHAGRDLEYSMTAGNGDPFVGHTRIYVVGTALYSLSFIHKKELDQAQVTELAQKYFSSFKLTPAR